MTPRKAATADVREMTPYDYDLAKHPMMRATTALPTRPIEELVNAIRGWLDYLLPGALVWGRVRVGKSEAISYICGNAGELLGSNIPTFRYSCAYSQESATTEGRFFESLLVALGYELAEFGRVETKKQRTIEFLVEQAKDRGEDRVILFVDEAQWLGDMQYRYLMILHNELNSRGVRLITILVGQPELLEAKRACRSAGKGHVMGRFMTCTHHFQGVVGEADLGRLLSALDDGDEFPVGSGWSYSAFFAPRAFEAGFRLEPHAVLIWRTIQQVLNEEGLPEAKETTMQAVAALLRALLCYLRERDRPLMELSSEDVGNLVRKVVLEQLRDQLAQPATKATRSARTSR